MGSFSSTPLIAMVDSVCTTLQTLLKNPNLSAQQRNLVNELCATCKAFSGERDKIMTDPALLQAFLAHLMKAIRAAKDVVPRVVTAPLEAMIAQHAANSQPGGLQTLKSSTHGHKRRRTAKKTTKPRKCRLTKRHRAY